MKKHKYKDMFHCNECFKKSMKDCYNYSNYEPSYFLVSPNQFKLIEKYGFTEGMLRHFRGEVID